jgi:hypothetical protein
LSARKKKQTKRNTQRAARVPRRRLWVRYSDERLLGLRFRDLELRIERTALQQRVQRLYEELEHRGLRFRPHVWLSTDWFSPEGVPGIAIPFYLAHPRLAKLEARQMLEVEGGSERECMRILRHEAGHAIDSAYRLHFKRSWHRVFGHYSRNYPQFYRPKPNSRNYVVHLDSWYAQAHPSEDFAETFAVWLKPRSSWRRRYRDWPRALAKLEYVDELMREIGDQPRRVTTRQQIDPLNRLSQSLEQYYEKKRRHYGAEWTDLYDRDLRKLFSDDRRHAGRPTAASFLRAVGPQIRATVAEWTGTHAYTIDQVLQDMIERSRVLRLRLASSPARARTQATILLTVHTMNCLHTRRHEIPI